MQKGDVAVRLFLTIYLSTHCVLTYCPSNRLCSTCRTERTVCETNQPSEVIPKGLPTGITRLKVSYNGETASLQRIMFSAYPHLEYLSITGHNISNIEDDTFIPLYRLKKLRIHSTNISCFPQNSMPINSSLQELKLDRNDFTAFPFSLLRNTPYLVTLIIRSNKIVLENCSTIGPEFSNLKYLRKLSLPQINVARRCAMTIPDDFFKPIYNTVENLNVSYMNIFGGSKKIFRNFSNLTVLDISAAKQFLRCPSMALKLFQNLPDTLKNLTLRRWRANSKHNRICAIKNTTLAPLSSYNLTSIDMKYGDSMFGYAISENLFRGFHHLQVLDISWCRITLIEDGAFDDCPKLDYLLLDGNPIGTRTFQIFSSKNITSLQKLSMRGCLIVSDEITMFKYWKILEHTSIKSVDLRNNYLYFFPMFSPNDSVRYPSVEELRLDINYISSMYINESIGLTTSFPYSCRALPNLVNLTINQNRLSKLDHLDMCGNLERLELAENNLERYWNERNQRILSKLYRLRELNIADNTITALSKSLFSSMPNLTRLILSGNNLTVTFPDSLHLNRMLEFLDLSSNSLHNFTASEEYQFPRLKELLLDSNSITVIDENLLIYFEKSRVFQKLGLTDNPLECGCNIEYFQNWVKTTRKLMGTSSQLRCAADKGKPIFYYERDRMACDILPILIPAATVLGAIILALLIGLPLYKYRWYMSHIKVVVGAIMSQILAVRLELRYEFDAYILYNSNSEEDVLWIKDKLCPAIESRDSEGGVSR